MTSKKDATLNLRVSPELKAAVKDAAAREHRSVANLIEWLVRRHCAEAGIPIPEQQSLFVADSAAE